MMTDSDTRVLFEVDGQVATLTLNRSDKLNAVDPPMLKRLESICHELDHHDGVRVVLLTGAGDRAFSVGADINAWSALEPLQMWRQWVRDGHRVLNRLATLRQPTVAVLNGYAFGGGLELALATDVRLASENVQLAMPEATLGTVPGWAGTERLPATIGTPRAKQMIFSGARIDAATAERWGLVNEVVPTDGLMARARVLAEEIAANSPVSVQLAKQIIDNALSGDAATTLEAIAGALAAMTEDGQEGLAAYREKRVARFVGR